MTKEGMIKLKPGTTADMKKKQEEFLKRKQVFKQYDAKNDAFIVTDIEKTNKILKENKIDILKKR